MVDFLVEPGGVVTLVRFETAFRMLKQAGYRFHAESARELWAEVVGDVEVVDREEFAGRFARALDHARG